MIHVIENKENTVFYECDCGTKGFCMIKPQEKDAAIVINVECPNCEAIECIVLLQYSSEKSRKKLLDDLNETELSWSSITK